MRSRTVAAFLLLSALAGGACGGGSSEDAGTAPAPAPSSEVRTGGPAPTSKLSTEGTAAPSAVEVRVNQTLSDLDAAPTGEGTVIVLPERVLFDFDRADLRAEAGATLDRIAEVIAFYAPAPVSIRGHTDSVGSDAYNEDLSRRRAEAVRAYLGSGSGVGAGRLEAVGVGERQPMVPDTRADGSDDPAARQQNRRVEVVLLGVRR